MLPPRVSVTTDLPGATRSTYGPWPELSARLPTSSAPPTPMTPSYAAGYGTGFAAGARFVSDADPPSSPVAAITTIPAFLARLTALSSTWSAVYVGAETTMTPARWSTA